MGISRVVKPFEVTIYQVSRCQGVEFWECGAVELYLSRLPQEELTLRMEREEEIYIKDVCTLRLAITLTVL